MKVIDWLEDWEEDDGVSRYVLCCIGRRDTDNLYVFDMSEDKYEIAFGLVYDVRSQIFKVSDEHKSVVMKDNKYVYIYDSGNKYFDVDEYVSDGSNDGWRKVPIKTFLEKTKIELE